MKALQITGIVAVVLGLFVGVVVLPVVGRFLKKAHRVIQQRARELPGQVSATTEGMAAAQVQIDALIAATTGVKRGMETAIGLADRAVAFLNSTAFQVGLPALIWTLFLFIALPRGLRGRRKKSPGIVPIPPPSWEREQA